MKMPNSSPTNEVDFTTSKVLICTIGGSPAIVTETVWKLKTDFNWIPTEVHIVTTSDGYQNVIDKLQNRNGPLAELFEKDQFPPVIVYVPKMGTNERPPAFVFDQRDNIPNNLTNLKENSLALRDILNEEEALLMGDVIYCLISQFIKKPNCQLNISLAGGRKTMSAHAMAAYSILGRPQDKISHVIVVPSIFEYCRDFWYTKPGTLVHRLTNPSDPLSIIAIDAGEAQINLVEITVPLMREYSKDMARFENMSLYQASRQLDLTRKFKTDQSVTLDLVYNRLEIHGVIHVLTPRDTSFLWLIFQARKRNWQGVGPEGTSDAGSGWVSILSIIFNKTELGERILDLYLEMRKLTEYNKFLQDNQGKEGFEQDEYDQSESLTILEELCKDACDVLNKIQQSAQGQRAEIWNKLFGQGFASLESNLRKELINSYNVDVVKKLFPKLRSENAWKTPDHLKVIENMINKNNQNVNLPKMKELPRSSFFGTLIEPNNIKIIDEYK